MGRGIPPPHSSLLSTHTASRSRRLWRLVFSVLQHSVTLTTASGALAAAAAAAAVGYAYGYTACLMLLDRQFSAGDVRV